jgi:CheY-like chemotaxis protein
MQDATALRGLRLLLVEDQYALAVTLADVAVAMGADVVGPVASVADALALIEKLPELDAAVLDVHLGADATWPVADALVARGLPFLFATAEAPAQLPERFRHVPLCRKPFGVAAFRDALARLAAPDTRPEAA